MRITPSSGWRRSSGRALLKSSVMIQWAPRGKRRYSGVSQQELPQLKPPRNGAGGISLVGVGPILFQTSVSFRHP